MSIPAGSSEERERAIEAAAAITDDLGRTAKDICEQIARRSLGLHAAQSAIEQLAANAALAVSPVRSGETPAVRKAPNPMRSPAAEALRESMGNCRGVQWSPVRSGEEEILPTSRAAPSLSPALVLHAALAAVSRAPEDDARMLDILEGERDRAEDRYEREKTEWEEERESMLAALASRAPVEDTGPTDVGDIYRQQDRWEREARLRSAAQEASTILESARRRAEDETPECNPDDTYAYVCEGVRDALDALRAALAVSPDHPKLVRCPETHTVGYPCETCDSTGWVEAEPPVRSGEEET